MDYWEECISEALEECGIKATDEQIQTIAGWAEGAHENYGMAFGHDAIPNPLIAEIEALKLELKKEQETVVCPECLGKGRLITLGPIHSYNSECSTCRSKGKVYR